jgi:CheY-like chemotaxis protein
MAEGGEEAVRQAAERPFDVILMDVRMPKVDGLQATRRIRALPDDRAQVPILALTAYTFPDQVAQCLDAGMDGHLPKPVDYQTLMDGIGDVIARVASGGIRRDRQDARAAGRGVGLASGQDRSPGPIATGAEPVRTGADARVALG